MDALRDYIRQISLYMIFDLFIGIIFTNQKYKKYISLISGLILILIMISPIKKIFCLDNLNNNLSIFHKNNHLNKLEIYKDIKNIYIKQIKNIGEDAGLKITKIEVNLKEQTSIKNLKIKLMDGDESNINKFKNTLCLFYDLDIEDINISWFKAIWGVLY